MTDPHVPFPIESFAPLAAAEAGNWWFRARNQLILWALKTKLPTVTSYLEIGCGTGFVLEAIHRNFPAATLRGTEYFEEGLAFARTRVPAASFAQLDATTMTDTALYDAIGAFDVIEHIADDETVLANIARALRDGGSLVATVPQHRWLWSAADEYACHVRRYTRAEFTEKAERAGLTVRYTTSFISLLLPLMFISRRKKTAKPYDPMAEFRLPRWMNAAFETITAIERALIRCGIRFPAGGSLLVVATKSPTEASHAHL